MAEREKFYLTTAIDYPNSKPHIGTAFEKIGADVLARYPQAYCDEMAGQFKEIWRALDISFDDFIQTSEPRHHAGCRQFIQKVFDAGYIYKGTYEGLYCEGCEAFKTKTEIEEGGGV